MILCSRALVTALERKYALSSSRNYNASLICVAYDALYHRTSTPFISWQRRVTRPSPQQFRSCRRYLLGNYARRARLMKAEKFTLCLISVRNNRPEGRSVHFLAPQNEQYLMLTTPKPNTCAAPVLFRMLRIAG